MAELQHGWIELVVASTTTLVNVVTVFSQNYYCLVQLGNALSESGTKNSFQKMLAKQSYRHMFNSHEPINMVKSYELLKPVYRCVIPHRTGGSAVVIAYNHVKVLADMCCFMNCKKNRAEFLESFERATVSYSVPFAVLESRATNTLTRMHKRARTESVGETEPDTLHLTATIQRLRTEIMIMKSDHDKAIRALNAKHDSEMAAMRRALREQHAIELEQIRAEQNTAMSLF